MTTLPPVLLLDLDDTIVHFSQGRPDFWALCFEAHRTDEHPDAETFSRAIREAAAAYWRDPAMAARGRQDLFRARREVAAMAFARLGIDDIALAHRIADDFTTTKEDAVAPFAGAIDALRALTARSVRLGLITNGAPTFQRRKLERFDLARHFEAILIEGEWGVGKPDPTIFQEALSRLNAQPHDAWMVGDNLEADIAGAQRVGIHAVWIDHAGKGPPAGARPDHIVRRLGDLVDP